MVRCHSVRKFSTWLPVHLQKGAGQKDEELYDGVSQDKATDASVTNSSMLKRTNVHELPGVTAAAWFSLCLCRFVCLSVSFSQNAMLYWHSSALPQQAYLHPRCSSFYPQSDICLLCSHFNSQNRTSGCTSVLVPKEMRLPFSLLRKQRFGMNSI